MKKYSFALGLLLALAPSTARADVSVLLLEGVGVAGEFTGSGHAAIYLSNICSDGPVELRLCQPGETGVVISNYPGFGKDASYEWIATPVIPYLYGVENEKDIPLYANGKIRRFLRETYRQKHLRSVIPDNADGSIPEGSWRTMLGMTFNRDIYSFNIKTTSEEDEKFLKEFTSLPNENRFNSFNRNCADFVRKTINRYFPQAARRDLINDFGISTPKAIAKSLTQYATDRPELLFTITRYPQVAGPIWRSSDNRNFTETAFTSKKYVIPSLLFEPALIGIFASTYLITGRFDVHQAHQKLPTPEIAQLNLEEDRLNRAKSQTKEEVARLNHSAGAAERDDPAARLKAIAAKKEFTRLRFLGNDEIRKRYREIFAPILARAINQGLFIDREEVKTFFRDLEIQSEPALDEKGALILKVRDGDEERVLGLTRDNIISANSDVRLASKLLLAKVYADLYGKAKNRVPLVTYEEDWALMDRLLARFAAADESYKTKPRSRFLAVPLKTSAKRKLEKFFIGLTH